MDYVKTVFSAPKPANTVGTRPELSEVSPSSVCFKTVCCEAKLGSVGLKHGLVRSVVEIALFYVFHHTF